MVLGQDQQPDESGLDDQAGAGLPGSETTPDGQAEGSTEAIDAQIEKAIERAVERRLAAMSQDLDGVIERRVQSFSDRATARLTREQQTRLEQVDKTVAGLKDYLGQDYEQVRTRLRLDALTDRDQGSYQTQPEGSPAGQPAAQTQQGADYVAAESYLTMRLGSPDVLSPQDAEYLRTAQGWPAWYKRVDEIAQRAGQRQQAQNGQSGQRAGRGNVAAAQPGAGRGAQGAGTPEALMVAYNRAVADGDTREIDRIGQLIDRLVNS
jgi:hypothetical protein